MNQIANVGKAAVVIVALLGLGAGDKPAAAPIPPLPTATIVFPATNMPTGGVTIGDHLFVYAVADPLVHRSPSYGMRPGHTPTFRTRVYGVPFYPVRGRLHAGRPRLLFVRPPGMAFSPTCLAGDWLLYEENIPLAPLTSAWLLSARNLVTGRVVTLDSSVREGPGYSIVELPACDMHTVVWKVFILGQPRGQATTDVSVVRAYDLLTGGGRSWQRLEHPGRSYTRHRCQVARSSSRRCCTIVARRGRHRNTPRSCSPI